jgi:hypothetical protein
VRSKKLRNGPLRAVKGTEERDESQIKLAKDCAMSTDTFNTVIHRVYLTWKHPHRWIEVIFPVT